MSGSDIQAVAVLGEFAWHTHADADEMFLILTREFAAVIQTRSVERTMSVTNPVTEPRVTAARQPAPSRDASGRARVTVVSVAIALLLIATFAYVSPGAAMWWTFIPAMVIACALHLASTAIAAPDPARVLPIYLVALAWQFLHFAEEFMNGFYQRWPDEVFSASAMSVEFFVWGNMASYAAFALGALAIYKGWRVPLLITWFFAIMGVAGNAIGHPIYAIISGDFLFPGTITAFAYWIIGPVLIWRLWHSSRTARLAPARG